MNKEEFLNEVVERMYKTVEAEKITITRTEKNNGVTRAGITIKTKDSAIAPIVYLDDMFSAYKTNKKSMKEIIETVILTYQAAKTTTMLDKATNIFSFESSRNNLFIKICNHKSNENRLEGLVHQDFLDLAIIPYIKMEMDDNSLGSVAITKDLVEAWNKDETEIINLAIENTKDLFHAINRPLFDVIKSFLDTDIIEDESSVPPVYVLSNEENVCGSMFLVIDEVLEKIRKNLNVEEFYILPSSIHELLLVTDTNANPNDLLEMVCDVNATQVLPEEVLANSIYKYSENGLEITATKER